MEKISFRIDEQNEYLKEQYSKENFRVEELNVSNNTCYIFFSGNGLYFPNEYEVFEEEILRKDRYEWENVTKAKFFRDRVGKIIFVRDIYKSWYINGINKECDGVWKVKKLLEELTKEKEVITVGNSAGGYAAVLFGSLLSAKAVLCFSGQFNLWNHKDILDTNHLIRKYKNDIDKSKFYDLRDWIEETVPIYYFYPGRSEEDVRQSEVISGMENVFPISFDTKAHGVTVNGGNYPYLLVMDLQKLKQISIRYRGKEMSPGYFFALTRVGIGSWNYLKELLYKYMVPLVKEILFGIKEKRV